MDINLASYLKALTMFVSLQNVICIPARCWLLRSCSFGGGYGKATTWAEYAQERVDDLMGHCIQKEGFPNVVTNSTLGLSFDDQVRGLYAHDMQLQHTEGFKDISGDQNDAYGIPQFRKHIACSSCARSRIMPQHGVSNPQPPQLLLSHAASGDPLFIY